MVNVPYTQPIWNVYVGTTGSTAGPVVPAGQLWVIRSMVVNNYKSHSDFYVGYIWLVETTHQSILAGFGHAQTAGDQVMVCDVRQAIPAGTNLQLQNDVSGWQVAVTGYKFQTP